MKSKNYKKYRIFEYDELGSSNDEAMKMAGLGHFGDGDLVVAKCQNKGRGRLGRVWVSEIGNLYFSLILQPKLPISRISEISFVAIVALRLAIAEILPKNGQIYNKWPNDLLVNDKKVAGLLLESQIKGEKCDFVVVGIGVNLVSKPAKTMFEAACLQDFGIKIAPNGLLERFLDKFDEIYDNWLKFGFLGIRNLWLQKAWKIGEKISINQKGEILQGIFQDLDLQGNLVLLQNGQLQKVVVGDVS